MMQRIEVKVLLLFVLVFITLVAYASVRLFTEEVNGPIVVTNNLTANDEKIIIPVVLDEREFAMEVSDTQETQQKGLSGRGSLCEICGMIFVFEKPSKYGIWMKDMLLSIDVLWLNENKYIIHIVENMQPRSYPKSYYPPSDAKYIIEVPNGTVYDLGLKVDDRVRSGDKIYKL